MFCTVCGHELDDNAKFCTACGSPVVKDAGTAADVSQQPAEYAGEQQVQFTDGQYVGNQQGQYMEGQHVEYQQPVEYAADQQGQYAEGQYADYQQGQYAEGQYTDYQQGQYAEGQYTDYQQGKYAEGDYQQQGGESVYVDYTPEKEPDKNKLNSKIIAIAAAITAIIVMAIGITAVVLIGGKKDSGTTIAIGGTTAGGVDGGIETTSVPGQSTSFFVNIYSAERDSDTIIQDASVSFYPGSDNSSGEPVFVIGNGGATSQTQSQSLEDGEYTIVVNAPGYFGCTTNVTVADGEGVDVFLTPKPEAGTIVYRVEWDGDQDLDICAFNATEREYISIGSYGDALGTYVSKDNTADKGFELLFLPQTGTDDVRTVYVVDSAAAKNGTGSTMERDGVRVIAYDSNGEIYNVVADTSKTEPVWNVGYVHNGRAYKDTMDYVADCDTDNIWAQYMKEGQAKRMAEKVVKLNSTGYSAMPVFNPEVDNYVPGERGGDKSWDMSVFYALEEEHDCPGYYDKNLCILKKLQVRNELTGNIVDYDIYLNPMNNLPNKIVSIEYIPSGIEVYEYYYENSGKVSFIFHYYADNYVSTHATVGKAGERFLFCDDTLVTWRVVQPGNIVDNYCYGNAEKQRLMDGSWNKKSIREYNSLSSDLRNQFDEYEDLMIDYAYNTYNMAVNTEAVGRIIGVLYKDDYVPCPNVDVEVYDSSFNEVLFTAKTDADGEYCIYVPAEDYNYNLRVKGSTEDNSCDIYNVQITSSAIVFYVDTAFYFESETADQNVVLYIGNAFEGHGSNIVDAKIYVRKGINNRRGDCIVTSQTDSTGYVSMSLKPGVYTIEACKTGYESIFYTIVASPFYSNQYEYYTPPTLSEGEYAIVLSWGEYPYDIDSHLFTNGDGTSAHVWYQNQYDKFNSYLDVDDRVSYGPETITIRSYDQSFYYKYCVVDYSNSSAGNFNSTEMSFSNATVNVYSAGGHVATYHVPFNRQGVVWEVFEIRNGVLTPIQRYYNNMDDQSWWMN